MGLSRAPVSSVLAISVVAGFALSTTIADQASSTADLVALANQNLGLRASSVVTLQIDRTPSLPLAVVLPFEGESYTLDFAPHSVRSERYEVKVQVAGGSYVTAEPGPVRTLRGRVRGIDGSVVAGSMLDEGLHAVVKLADGRTFWVEPLEPHVPGAGADTYVVYDEKDAMPCGFSCATETQQGQTSGSTASSGVLPCAGGLCVAEVACDTDVEYFQSYGTVQATEARINSVINAVNAIYKTQVGITHVITTIIVRTAEPDPYDADTVSQVLTQLLNHWNSTHGAVQRDLVQMFSGNDFSATDPFGRRGAAKQGAACAIDLAYSAVQSDWSDLFLCVTFLSAHEIGHIWNASHCSAGPDCGIMVSSGDETACSDQFFPTAQQAIIAKRDAVEALCLDTVNASVCEIATGTCCEFNGTFGCNDLNCCEAVCAIPGYEYCCLSCWDLACAVQACNLPADCGCVNCPPPDLQNCCGPGDCADGLFCNGEEICDGLFQCAAGTDPCTDPAIPFCDETANTCLECLQDMHCDDAEVCTLDECIVGVCSNTPFVDCDDNDVCTFDLCVDLNCTNTPSIYGDVDNNGSVNLFDLFCVLDGFEGEFSHPDCVFSNADLNPCPAGNNTINLFDMFAVLDAFEGIDPCCGAQGASGGGSSPGGGTVTISVTPRQRALSAGGEWVVDVFAAGFVDLRGYQIALGATGGSAGRLDLEKVYIDTGRNDHVFAGLTSHHAVDKANGRMACVLSSGGVDSQTPVYLATFVFRASSDAAGMFTVSAIPGDGTSGTMTADSTGTPTTVQITSAAEITIP